MSSTCSVLPRDLVSVEVAAEQVFAPPSDLVDQVHVSGALSGACTGKARQMANPRPTPKPANLRPPWPPGTSGNPAGYSRGRPLRELKMIVGSLGIPLGLTPPGYEPAPHTGLDKAPPHERGMKAGSMPERLLIGPGSPHSIDPVYPELSPPPEPCPELRGGERLANSLVSPRRQQLTPLPCGGPAPARPLPGTKAIRRAHFRLGHA